MLKAHMNIVVSIIRSSNEDYFEGGSRSPVLDLSRLIQARADKIQALLLVIKVLVHVINTQHTFTKPYALSLQEAVITGTRVHCLSAVDH
eukprot:scaffold26767_cov153-Skeletonema_menzelii.AAC.1